MSIPISKLLSIAVVVVFLSGIFCAGLMTQMPEKNHSMDHTAAASMVHCCASVSIVVMPTNFEKEIPQASMKLSPLLPEISIPSGIKTSIYRPPKTA